jgi:lipopolysaccharide transport system ATP-binding protein
MSDTAIKIENLRKQYRLGTIGGGTLSADLQSWWARKRGKEDPNIKIGVNQENIGKTFYALDGINLEVKKGEAVGIIGGNGAGKSTLLKILSRVTAPTEGKIGINGRITSMLEVGTGFHPELTGRENIYMNGAILGMTKAEIDGKIEDIIDFSECRKFIDTPVKRYSSGMYVKLAFSVAANLDSEIMIMDEVLAVGDVKFQQKCLGKMGDAADNEGKTILYVSHNMSTIRQLCTRCVVLEHGHVIYDGDVDKAIDIYIQSENNDFPVNHDLGKTPRPSLDHGKNVHIDRFDFLNVEKACFGVGEKIKARISWHGNSEYDVDDIRLYIVLKNGDDTPVGVAVSERLGDAKYNQNNSADVILNFSGVMPGKYYFMVNVVTSNSFGTLTSHDRPNQKIFFEIIQENENKTFEWKHNFMGSILFPPITLIGK